MNDSVFKQTDIKIWKNYKLLEYNELVYPVNNKRSPSIMDPEGADEGQDQSQSGRKEAQYLVREAHGLGRGQGRVSDLQNAVAGS
jgi:hypothetical protein